LLDAAEELVGEALGDRLEEPLADARDRAADVVFALVVEEGAGVLGGETEGAGAAEAALAAGALHFEAVAGAGLLVGDADRAPVSAADRGDADRSGQLVFIGTGDLERLAARHAGRQHRRVEDRLPDPLRRRGEDILAAQIQRRTLPGQVAGRLANAEPNGA
jgi:hypothetical protein